MKTFFITSTFIFFSFLTFSQQCSGPNTTTDVITRTGRIGVGGLTFGPYGAAIVGDANPYFIAGDETHDLLIFGSSAATLHFRLFDGDLKLGSATTLHLIALEKNNQSQDLQIQKLQEDLITP
jgi:hypothetical protein